ncbi:hypothetical protein HKCCE2091_02870 [Rhodobacterales bacterium HKCCE2091]|nr:hypothetical protein [Rhodobacterales bacterium HKCCE2091]
MARGTRKSLVGWSIRLAGSAVMLGVLFWILPADTIVRALSRIPVELFVAVFALFLLSHVAAAAKWWLLLDRGLPYRLALRAHFAGLAANLCLPGAVGGDAVRAAVAYRAMPDVARVAAGSVADRVIDLLALCLLSGIGLLSFAHEGSQTALVLQAGFAVAAVALGLVYVLPSALPRLWSLVPRLPGRDTGLRIADAIAAIGRKPLFCGGILLFSMLIQGVLIVISLWLARGLGLEIGLAEWAFAWPLAKVLAVLPISLGGLGLREASLAALLAPLGASAPDVVAAGLAWQAVLWLTGGLGALVQVLPGLSGPPAAATNEKRAR